MPALPIRLVMLSPSKLQSMMSVPFSHSLLQFVMGFFLLQIYFPCFTGYPCIFFTSLTLNLHLCQDKSFTFILKTPPASVLLLKAAGIDSLSPILYPNYYFPFFFVLTMHIRFLASVKQEQITEIFAHF